MICRLLPHSYVKIWPIRFRNFQGHDAQQSKRLIRAKVWEAIMRKWQKVWSCNFQDFHLAQNGSFLESFIKFWGGDKATSGMTHFRILSLSCCFVFLFFCKGVATLNQAFAFVLSPPSFCFCFKCYFVVLMEIKSYFILPYLINLISPHLISSHLTSPHLTSPHLTSSVVCVNMSGINTPEHTQPSVL